MTDDLGNPLEAFAQMRAAIQAFAELDSLILRAAALLPEIPDCLRAAAVAELRGIFDAAFKSPAVVSSGATEAIFTLLKAAGAALTCREIQAGVRGKFRSQARDPRRVVSTTLSQLRVAGRLSFDGRQYRVPGIEDAK